MQPYFWKKNRIRNFAQVWRRVAFAVFASSVFASCALAQPPVSALCEDGICKPAISQTTYFNRPAYQLTDGKTEAVIVPTIGRIMRYGKVGGPNLMWNASSTKAAAQGWSNYGGDKTWLAPQSSWKQFHGKDYWPPDTAFDGKPHEVEVISGGKLRMTTPFSPGTGMRISRLMYFNARGEFVIEQTATKLKGAPIRASIWSITQTLPGDAVFLPVRSGSDYALRYAWLSEVNEPMKPKNAGQKLIKVVPRSVGGSAKFGVDADVSSIVSVHGGVAWKQSSTKPQGAYPDGMKGAGFPVELYINGDSKTYYQELELLGPIKTFAPGGKSTHIVRWSLHDLSSTNVDAPEVVDEVERLIFNR